MISLLGYVAAALTASAFAPQIVKAWRTRSAGDLSILMLAAQGSGVALWTVYGVAIRARPIIVANLVTLVLTLTLLFLKAIYHQPAATGRHT